METFEDLSQKTRDNIEKKFSKARDTPVSVKHVETSIAENNIILSIEGDLLELFPELDDDGHYKEASIREIKISVTPSRKFADIQNAEFPNC